jgi:hypothetical protein
LIESWKQSVLAAVVVIVAIVTGVGLQAWSLEHAATPEVTGIVLSFSGTMVVLTDGTRFELAPRPGWGSACPCRKL